MIKNRTQEEFIEKCKEKINLDLYDLSLVEYVSSTIKIDIFCKRCNTVFQITPSNFFFGKGCKTCNKKEAASKQRKSLKEVLSDFKNIYGDKYDYSYINNYENNHTKLKIYCGKHGFFEKSYNKHLKQGCPKCLTKNHILRKNTQYEKFIKKAKEIHKNKYIYDKVDYINCKTKVSIYCKFHKEYFLQIPSDHISVKEVGCPKCGIIKLTKSQTKSYSKFLQEARNLHGNCYIYKESTYTNCKSKMEMYCKKHDSWYMQTPDSHLIGHSPCQKCKIEKITQKSGENPPSWNYSSWQKAAERSKNFDSYKVYILRCWNKTEEFYKIGRTFITIEKRFQGKMMPYNYEVVKTITFVNSRECCETELNLQRTHGEYKYVPTLKFDGMYECFSNIKKELITL